MIFRPLGQHRVAECSLPSVIMTLLLVPKYFKGAEIRSKRRGAKSQPYLSGPSCILAQ